MENKSYMFIPFILERGEPPDAFRPLVEKVGKSRNWVQQTDEVRYMYKYVSDKFDCRNPKQCQCFHYRLEETSRGKIGIPEPGDRCRLEELQMYHGHQEYFGFYILEIHLYLFSTSVGIVAFKLRFEKNNPLWIASAQYYLKKAARQMICTDGGGEEATTVLALSRKMMSEFGEENDFDFFFYANEEAERAHFLTFLPVVQKDDYRYELYFLRRGYREGVLYIEDEDSDYDVIHRQSEDVFWGISTEAAVCLVCPELDRTGFIENTLSVNFDTQYLFMYIMLLHQKYVLYRFLTKIGVGAYNSLDRLENYREQLYEFESDFLFDCVTEVPQYQLLYDKMTKAFALKKMYQDVREPITKLSEMRWQTMEKERARQEERLRKRDLEKGKRDENVNRALIAISVLSVFSALADSFQFAGSFLKGFHVNAFTVTVFQGVFIGVILAVFFWALLRLIPSIGRCRKRRSYYYVGFFVDFEELTEKVQNIRRNPLSGTVMTPHVTYEFQPETADTSLFGEEVDIQITGYGNDGRNEGLKVSVVSRNRRLQTIISRIEVPHITLAISGDGLSVDTRHLEFEPLNPIHIKGRFGGFTFEDGVVYEND